MKAFIYSKKDNHTIAVIDGIQEVQYDHEIIRLIDSYGMVHEFPVKGIKTRIYQN